MSVALVTGGAGYIGRKLIERLASDGWRVHALVRPTPQTPPEDLAAPHVFDGTIESMDRIVEESAPDVVFHLASLFRAEHKPAEISALVESNITLGTMLADAMSRAGVLRLVNTGTTWQCLDNRDYSPVCLYAATKQAFEVVLRYYQETAHLRTVTLRLGDVYGADDPRPRLFKALRQALNAPDPLAMSAGEQYVDMVYVDDAIEAYVAASTRLLDGLVDSHEVYAVTSGAPTKLRDVVIGFFAAHQAPVNVEFGKRPYRQRETFVPWTNGATLPGWRPTIDVAAGLRRIAEHDR
jgi:nucleoside-diphosphate-sugar epimerase